MLTCALPGCATERLGAAAPPGVDLTGEWNLNVNLSDDPDRMGDADKPQQQRTPGRRGHGGRGGGGMSPMGGPGSGYFLPVAQDHSTPPPPADSGPGRQAQGRSASINRMFGAPAHVSITQQGGSLIVKTNMTDGTQTADEYTAGTVTNIPFGHDKTAERSAGWRGPVFVVSLTVKKGGWREDDFALDDDGRLIMTTQTKGGRGGSTEIKRVYDRVRGQGGPE
jgi:hypothetical protein